MICILQVNGQDLSGASHEEAIRIFNEASEPIVVEVIKRCNSELSNGDVEKQHRDNMSSTSAMVTTTTTASSHYGDDDDTTSMTTTRRRGSATTTTNNNNSSSGSDTSTPSPRHQNLSPSSGCDVATQTAWMVPWPHPSRYGHSHRLSKN